MTPLFACFPVCITLSVIGLIGVVMLAFGLGNRIPGDDQPATPVPGASAQKAAPPPLWVFPLTLLLVALLMLVLGWIWPQ